MGQFFLFKIRKPTAFKTRFVCSQGKKMGSYKFQRKTGDGFSTWESELGTVGAGVGG